MIRLRKKRFGVKHILILLTIILAVFMKIGYSYLTEELNITGTAVASKNVWDVHFVEGTINDSSSQISNCVNENQCSKITKHATIAESGTSIDFGVIFHIIGDYYEFTVDVINEGTVDAMLEEVVKEGLGSNSSYLTFDVTYSDGIPITKFDYLPKCGGKESLKVKVTFISAPENDVVANLGVSVNYIQADDNYVYRTLDPKTRILSLNTEGTQVVTTDHENELRFIGANPNNYVSFNNQKWRIIGVFNGQLKIVQDPIGGYSWDSSASTVNNGYGINQWGPSTNTDGTTYEGADLMKLLNPGYENNEDYDKNSNKIKVNNSLYWNAGSGICYKGASYTTGNCDFSATGLSDATSKNMIADATWSLGSLDTLGANIWDGRVTASLLYEWERSSSSGKQCSDGTYCSDIVNRTTSWTGKVGLIYPSDYAYATGGGTLGRADCLSKTVGHVKDSSIPNWQNTYTTCYQDDWLYPSLWIWTMSSRAPSSSSYLVFGVHSAGHVIDGTAFYAASVRPVVYLKSSVAFTQEGNGTQSNPFQLKATE